MSASNVEPTETRIVAYAVWFATERMETFDKDIAICLRADERDRHAYMPALIACTGMLELFACLYCGDLEARGNGRIVNFAKRFMNVEHYSETAIKVLWSVFRHKVAHVSKPYGVKHVSDLDTDDKKGLVTWEVTEYDREPAIQIVEAPGSISAERRPAWRSGKFTHKCSIHLATLARDIRNAISGPRGYIQAVREESNLQCAFKNCMDQCFEEFVVNGR